MSPRAKRISLAIGVLFAGNVLFLFSSIAVIEVPIAILTYFVYPLLTGLAAAATGLEKITWRGMAAAVVAFLGLALMIGAHPATLAVFGIVAALAAAGCRVALLLITRATLQGADARLITWYSLISSTALLTVLSLALMNWHPPATAFGWAMLVALSVAVMTGLLGLFASTARIGPFRTALLMNLEPPLTTIGSALFLGEVITPLQALGGAVMLRRWWRSSCAGEQPAHVPEVETGAPKRHAPTNLTLSEVCRAEHRGRRGQRWPQHVRQLIRLPIRARSARPSPSPWQNPGRIVRAA